MLAFLFCNFNIFIIKSSILLLIWNNNKHSMKSLNLDQKKYINLEIVSSIGLMFKKHSQEIELCLLIGSSSSSSCSHLYHYFLLPRFFLFFSISCSRLNLSNGHYQQHRININKLKNMEKIQRFSHNNTTKSSR